MDEEVEKALIRAVLSLELVVNKITEAPGTVYWSDGLLHELQNAQQACDVLRRRLARR